MLEHVHRLHAYVQRLAELIGQHGKLLLALPNYNSSDAEHYGEHWAAYDVPRHLYHFSARSLEQLFSQHGLHIAEMRPMPFDPFYVSLLSERYRRGGSQPLPVGAVYQGVSSLLGSRQQAERASSILYVCEAV